MTGQTELSEAECELLVELLEHERSELPVEIRHTRTSSVRDELRRRAVAVKELLGRLKQPARA